MIAEKCRMWVTWEEKCRDKTYKTLQKSILGFNRDCNIIANTVTTQFSGLRRFGLPELRSDPVELVVGTPLDWWRGRVNTTHHTTHRRIQLTLVVLFRRRRTPRRLMVSVERPGEKTRFSSLAWIAWLQDSRLAFAANAANATLSLGVLCGPRIPGTGQRRL